MKRTKKEMQEYQTIDSEPDDYPYGLCISLDDDALSKLGFNGSVGDEVMIMAKAKIKSKHQHEDEDGEKDRGMSLQITDMSIADDSKTREKKMYGE